jgi:hypothetical protein
LTGIKENALADLTPAQADIVMRLLARVSEASYRRGAQQGATLLQNYPERLPTCLAQWRFDSNEDQSPWLGDRHRTEPARQRLDCEYGGLLWHVGLAKT